MRSLLIGAAGSALVLLLDLTVTKFGDNDIALRIGIAAIAFVVFFFASRLVPTKKSGGDPESNGKKILSDIESGQNTEIDATKIESNGAAKIGSDIKSGNDTKINVDEITSR